MKEIWENVRVEVIASVSAEVIANSPNEDVKPDPYDAP